MTTEGYRAEWLLHATYREGGLVRLVRRAAQTYAQREREPQRLVRIAAGRLPRRERKVPAERLKKAGVYDGAPGTSVPRPARYSITHMSR